MKTILRALALVTVTLATSFGCSSEEASAPPDEVPTFNGVDKTLSCGAGMVGWNFSTGGSSLDNVQGSARSGIQVDVASWGLNCNAGLRGNTTTAIEAQCNGSTVCNFTPGSPKDPAVNCAKNFDVTWKCGVDSTPYTIHVDGEASGKPVSLKCGPQLTVQSATYGKNCGVAQGTHSSPIKAKCDGTRFCEYKVEGLGDPKVNCAKDYEATWSCGENPVQSSGRIAGEAGGKTLTLSCDPYYPIHVKTAEYGKNCGVPTGSFTKPVADLFNTCNGKQECNYGIDAKKLGDPKVGCAKDFVATYTCGDFPREYTVAATAEAGGKQLKLSCVGADGQNPAPAAKYPTGNRACVPAQCAWNQKRDAGMNCVADPSKQLITSGAVYAMGMLEPRTSTEPLQAGTTNVVALKANKPYKLRLDTDLEGPAGIRPRMVPWFTKQFRNPKTGEVAEGFLCTLSPVELYKDSSEKKRVKTTADPAILPTTCFDSRANAWADAAKRRNALEQDFRNTFVEITNKLHVSIDPEGEYGFVKTPGRTPTAPNPPGFYFDADRNYVDMIAFYQQRELTDVAADVAERALGPGFNTTSTFRSWQLAPSPSIDVGLSIARVPQGAYQRINYFDTANPRSTFEVAYSMSGDWPDNPFSPSSTQTRIPNVKARRVRATVQVYPYNDEGNAITLGAIPLDEATPTFALRSAAMEWPTALRDAIFGKWGALNSLDMKVCIDADGSNTRGSAVTTVQDGPTGYSLNINNNGCFRYTNALVFSRDFTKRVLAPEVSSSSSSTASTTSSGDSKSASSQDSGNQKGCTDSNGVHKCSATTRDGNTASGDTGRSTFGATTTAERTETATTLTTGPSGQGEVLGFQVIDVDDDENKRTFDKTKTNVYDGRRDPIKIVIEPNWDILIQSVKPQVPPPATVTKAQAGGRQGLGIGVESKAPVFGIGFATLSFAVAASLAIEFNMKWLPETPYSCTNGNRTKCFAALPTATTQAGGRKACEARGGRLAEMVTDSDRTAILAAAGSAQNYWTAGQLNYSFSDVTCARNQSSAACKNASTTKFAWLGSNKEFGSLAGTGGNAVLNANAKIGPAENGLTTNVPIDSGVVLHGATRAATTQPQSATFPPICEYAGAARTEYEEWTLGLAIGAAAGVTLGFCTPSEQVGICLKGSINFVDVSLQPQFGHRAWTLYDGAGNRFQRYGSTFVDEPFSLAIMSGQIVLVANFFYFSTSWTLSQYNGIKLLDKSLGRTDNTFLETF